MKSSSFFISLLFIIFMSTQVFAIVYNFDKSDLDDLPSDFTLICGIKYSDGTQQFFVHIENGNLKKYRDYYDLNDQGQDYGVGLLENGALAGYVENNNFVGSSAELVGKNSQFSLKS